mgnify:CR=1 FL=1
MVHAGFVKRLVDVVEGFDNSTEAVEFQRFSNRTSLAFGVATTTTLMILVAVFVFFCQGRR